MTTGAISETIGSIVRSIGALLILALLALDAAGASAGSDNREKIRLNAADQAAARATLIERADLRPVSGWRGGLVKPDLSASGQPTCPNYHPDVSRFVLTGAAASDWKRPGVALKSDVSVQTEVLQTANMVRREWQLQVEPPAFVSCSRAVLARTYAAEGGRLISYRKIPFPHIGTFSSAYRIVGEIRGLPFVAEFVLVATRRSEINLSLFGPSNSWGWVADQTVRLARILTSRARA